MSLSLKPTYINVTNLPSDTLVRYFIQSNSCNIPLLLDYCGPSLVQTIACTEIDHSPSDDVWVWHSHTLGKVCLLFAYTDSLNQNWYGWHYLWRIPVVPHIHI